jgi:hypothetical protein
MDDAYDAHIEAFIETDWLWTSTYEDYEANVYDGTYSEL